ncbi:DUF885 domain-containing protein [Pseudoxanthomonas daejeonensis]|uniref:DUF885 domain-containing protein n=1 Tax=Pseudoxanthomonas daejeonensis TaxID=266062 RepID=A0ABQ6ZA02_9GAMM|nr:DUF885 domain-containing protein [Pseudoxanthomonas daejeonensis]KAF1696480.1 DUF885 domain-containing protein [Pseudoxanthomonas daejeonensis]UNK57148.1 DUF885 domain-containing protein [Pseudoxanthomonas daejeonensis]
MRRTVLAAALAACCFPAFAAPAAREPAVASRNEAAVALHRLFDAEWERGLRESPENAAYQGDRRYDDRWSDMSLAAIARREAADREALEALQRIDRASLSPADQLNYDTFAWLQERAVARQKFREYLQPIGHQGGVQTADGIAELLPFASEQDYRNWIARLHALPVLLEQNTALMKAGAEAGSMPPKVLMQRVPAQIRGQVVEDPAKSPFYKPFLKMPESIPAATQEALRKQAREAIASQVVPAYREFGRYFEQDYLPRARDTIAATDLPDGPAYYDFLAGWYTTTDLTAGQIHEIGLKEVARIRAEMEKIRAEVGFKGDLHAFFQHLRTDPKFFHKDPADLLEAYQALSKRIDPELVKVFRTIPRLPYGVRAIPDNIAPDTTTAYYQPGAVDGSRAGFYYVNLYKPEVRPTWEMLALSLHEAVPGHHFQFARGAELPDLPMFRRTAYFVAYGEGWGLYAERLGYDMGLYDDPYDRMGQLAYDMWRAVRLVVDTGMHAKGWSRQQAIDFFMDNSPKTGQDVVNEIDRYIAWPGQALAYKIGQLRISALREEAARELGPAFDVRDFHDAVLDTGSVPLETLEKRVRTWIAERKRAGKPG